jgi:hypothetical protein
LHGAAYSKKMQLTVKRAVTVVGALLAVVSLSRVIVLFLEALSSVRAERSQDSELLELCAQGAARGSIKMRAACLQAQADRASPVVMKAVLRAVSTAFSDFSESVSSPGKLAVVALFTLSSVYLPIQGWIKSLQEGDARVEGLGHVVVLAENGLRRRSRSLKHVTVPFFEQRDEENIIEVDLGHEKRD